MLNLILKSVFGVWILTVAYYYFEYHPEYAQALSNSSKIFSTFLITFFIFYLSYFAYQYFFKDKEEPEVKISPALISGIGITSVFLVATIIFSKTSSQISVDYFSAISSYLNNLLPPFLTLLGIFISSFLLGNTISKLLKVNWAEEKKGVVNIGIGISTILLILFFIGWIGILTMPVVLGLFVVILILCFNSYKDLYAWFFAIGKEKTKLKILSINTFLIIALFYLIGQNIFDIIRPMPIGWDDMGVYLNMPQRIAEDAAALAGQGGQAWMMLTSLGFILWPHYISDTVALSINWFGGMLSVFAVFAFVKRFFNTKMAIFASTFYYFMPMIVFQSALDLKMDPTLFFFMVTGALILFDKGHGLLEKIHDLAHKITREEKIKWGLGGFILGTAFFIKITTAMEIFALVAALSFFIFNWKTALGVILLENAIFLPVFSQIPEFSDLTVKILTAIFFVSGLILIAISKAKKYQVKKFFTVALTSSIGFLFVAIPWGTFNYLDSGKLSFGYLVNGVNNEDPNRKIDLKSVGIDPEGKDKKYCEATGGEEEKGRYIGYDQPFIQKYFTLPWKNTMNTETRGYYLDIGFLFLALIPGLFLLGIWRNWGKKEWGIMILFCVNWWFWAFSAHGIPWYGLFGFLPALVLTGLVLYDEKSNKSYWKYGFLVLIVVSISAFGLIRETKTGNGNTVKYAFGLITGEKFVDSIVPTYRDTVKQIAAVPHTPENPNYVFRAGTFIPYFIKDVRRVMYQDSQLDEFKCIDGDGTNDQRTLERLRDLGFRFVIFDTNTATIEKDPNGSLHQKVKRFVDFGNKNLQVVYSKPKNGIAFMIVPTEAEFTQLQALKKKAAEAAAKKKAEKNNSEK